MAETGEWGWGGHLIPAATEGMKFACVKLESVCFVSFISVQGGYLERAFPVPKGKKNWFIPAVIWVTAGWVTPALCHPVSSVTPKGTGLSDKRRVAPGPQPMNVQPRDLRAQDMGHAHIPVDL